MALNVTFFPLAINGLYAETMRTVPMRSFINLAPFYIGTQHVIDSRDLVDFANNILLTIPCGLGIIFVSRLRPRDFLWLPLAVGFGIEIAQLLISLILGYPYRVVDINDALLNAVGVLAGYGLFRIFAWLFIRLTRRFKQKSAAWFIYFDEVVNRG
jgi:glycopeptide antibiotics resistance protein